MTKNLELKIGILLEIGYWKFDIYQAIKKCTINFD